MSATPPPERPAMRLDLTRWNRAGRSRFDYVDGDAAVWLEELRIALLGLYMRGAPAEMRTPEYWRDLFLRAPVEWPDEAERRAAEAALTWSALLPDFPRRQESAGARTTRLLEQYGTQSSDYAWEIMRACARAAHVLLGHLDAYANEGTLRTATQWDTVRRLAAMVNYQPTPPASATTSVALSLDPAKDGAEIARGLAMKYTPVTGGPPLIFETLTALEAHPALNAVPVRDWTVNTEALGSLWVVGAEDAPPAGALAALVAADGADPAPAAQAVLISGVVVDDAAGTAALTFDPGANAAWTQGNAVLRSDPADVRRGLPHSGQALLVLKVRGGTGYPVGSVVRLSDDAGAQDAYVVVAGSKDGYLLLSRDAAADALTGAITVEPLAPIDGADTVETPEDIGELFFRPSAGGPVEKQEDWDERTTDGNPDSPIVSRLFQRPDGTSGPGYARRSGTPTARGDKVTAAPGVLAGAADQTTVGFSGKMPKGLQTGDWFVARASADGTLRALRVDGVRQEADGFYIQFDQAPPAAPEDTEFHGRLTRALRPLHHDRSQAEALSGTEAVLAALPHEALALLKPGKAVIVSNTEPGQAADAAATLGEVERADADQPGTRITLTGTDQEFGGWKAGWTVFRLNTVQVSHGETKGVKTLGSGDGERRRQSFRLKVPEISFVPSTKAASGVVPDIDVAVDGVRWDYRDYTDPSAEGAQAWSVTLSEDGSLQIYFRRRLPTGSDNVAVSRHRVGVGLKGTGVPAGSFTKPMKKHRFVTGIVQPFATAGGADREPVSDIRTNAPARLAANDRAVSVRDIARLALRHASVWQAHATPVIAPGRANRVRLVVVPAGGIPTGSGLIDDLTAFILARALPNTRLAIEGFVSVPITLNAEVRVDLDRYDKRTVQEAAVAALVDAFTLQRRRLGQPLYRAELLAALEAVEGVSTAVLTGFARRDDAPAPAREPVLNGVLAAIDPHANQVVWIAGAGDVAVLAKEL